mmetsp:Transcript_32982/g.91078  ORF Transcript_32982/g.91078 Transcript_32982/m.91078 type:complete len:219 (-) Transcript_32982:73-729(-)
MLVGDKIDEGNAVRAALGDVVGNAQVVVRPIGRPLGEKILLAVRHRHAAHDERSCRFRQRCWRRKHHLLTACVYGLAADFVGDVRGRRSRRWLGDPIAALRHQHLAELSRPRAPHLLQLCVDGLAAGWLSLKLRMRLREDAEPPHSLAECSRGQVPRLHRLLLATRTLLPAVGVRLLYHPLDAEADLGPHMLREFILTPPGHVVAAGAGRLDVGRGAA